MALFFLIISVLTWYFIKTYILVKPLEISINESESNIKVILQKRLTIIDKLNHIVNSYSRYEKDIVQRLSEDMRGNSNNMFTINRLYDAYPELKLNDTFQDQIERLYSIETERQVSIEYFNNRVKSYNQSVTSFPAIIICSIMSFKEKQFFI